MFPVGHKLWSTAWSQHQYLSLVSRKQTQRNYKPTQQVNKTTRHNNQQRSLSHPISVVVTIMFIMLVAFVVVGRWQWLMVVVAMVVVR